MHRFPMVTTLALTLAFQAQAGVYKCQGANGRLSFSNRPCPEEQQLEHRLSPEDKAQQRLEEQHRQAEQAATERKRRLQKPGLEEGATQRDEYERMMEKLAGQVYRQQKPELATATATATKDQPDSTVDDLVGDLIHNLERELVFEVESGNTLDPVQNSPEDRSVQQVRRYLDDNLHAPQSLDIEEWGPVMKVVQFNPEDFSSWKEYRVRLIFRSKNRLGAYVRLDQVFILDENGQIIGVVDFDGRPLSDY